MKELYNIDFTEFVDLEYDIYQDCDNNGCYDKCRCSKIINAKISNVNVSNIVNYLHDIHFSDNIESNREYKLKKLMFNYGSELDLYVIDRVLRYFKIWDNDIYEINKEIRFYGEEITSINVKKNIADKITDKINSILNIDTIKDRVIALVEMEYGYVLPEFYNSEYEILEISKCNILYGSKSHHKKVMMKNLDFYADENYNGIRGLVSYTNDKYRVIDGYHRIHITNKSDIYVINIKEQ